MVGIFKSPSFWAPIPVLTFP